MIIENYLANIDAYRYSTAKVVFPLPLLINRRDPRLTKKLQGDQALRMLILTLLEEHRIESTDLDFINLSKPFYPNGGDTQVLTLRINVDVGDSVSTALWPAASMQLRKLLSSREYYGVEVEIIDPKRHFLPSLFPLRPEDTSVRAYESRREGIITVIMKRLSTSWSSTSLFKIGRNFSKATPAIVVMVRPKAHAHWWSIKRELRAIAKLQIEFVVGSCQLLPPSDPSDMPGRQFTHNFTAWPKMGCSIGVEGEKRGGTLGGFYTLHCHGMKHEGFLTNA